MGWLGGQEIILILIIVILLFGAKKIPELMRGVGRGVKEFKDSVNKDYTAENRNEPPRETPAKKDDEEKKA